jgi:hypothetical protein
MKTSEEWSAMYYRERIEHEKSVDRLTEQIEELTELVIKLRLKINEMDNERHLVS